MALESESNESEDTLMNTRTSWLPHAGYIACVCLWLGTAQADPLKSPDELVAAAKATIREVPAAEVQNVLGGEALIIDVREPEEFAAGHIPGAINVPRGVLEFRILNQPGLKDNPDPAGQPILLYCGGGGRGALATQSLQALGFTNAYNLAGGLNGWKEAGRAVEGTTPVPAGAGQP
jgi:rhodanese-related sulfurtransferase